MDIIIKGDELNISNLMLLSYINFLIDYGECCYDIGWTFLAEKR